MVPFTPALFDALHTLRPVLLWGPPGVGKSARVESAAPCETVLVSTLNPSDLTGTVAVIGQQVQTLKPSWLTRLEALAEKTAREHAAGERPSSRVILFFDELNTAPPAVSAPALRICQERRVGEWTLPSNCVIVAACNASVIGGYDLSPALLNRFGHLSVDGNDCPDFFRASPDWRLKIVGSVLAQEPSWISRLATESAPAAPSPRTWEAVAKALPESGPVPGYWTDLASALVGPAAAKAVCSRVLDLLSLDIVATLRGPARVFGASPISAIAYARAIGDWTDPRIQTDPAAAISACFVAQQYLPSFPLILRGFTPQDLIMFEKHPAYHSYFQQVAGDLTRKATAFGGAQ